MSRENEKTKPLGSLRVAYLYIKLDIIRYIW